MESGSAVCPVFASGCPYSSLEESNVFKKYLDKCKMFEEGCPFKDMDVVEQIKAVLAGDQFSKEYSDKVMTTHQNLSASDWTNIKAVCPAFSEGCVFAKALEKSNHGNLPNYISCPVWKNGCPFKTMLSDGKRSLVEALQSNSWDILVHGSLIEEKQEESNEKEEKKENKMMLALMLKEGTQKSHSLAESVQFVKRFRKKEITKELYQLLIRNLYFVYAAMEELMEEIGSKSKNLETMNFPVLHRFATLEQDLEFFYGENWKACIMTNSINHRDVLNMSPATANYVTRLRQCAQRKNAGELLIAHAYTRYLGDLSGGQLLKRMTRRSLGLTPAPRNATTKEIRDLPADQVDGTKFYDFLDIEDADKFKVHYRTTLDSLEITSEVANEMVEEANVAFRLNMEMFQELDNFAGFTEVESETNVKPLKDPHEGRDMSGVPPAECPFSAMLSGKTPASSKPQTREVTPPAEHKVIPGSEAASPTTSYYRVILLSLLCGFLALLVKFSFMNN